MSWKLQTPPQYNGGKCNLHFLQEMSKSLLDLSLSSGRDVLIDILGLKVKQEAASFKPCVSRGQIGHLTPHQHSVTSIDHFRSLLPSFSPFLPSVLSCFPLR